MSTASNFWKHPQRRNTLTMMSHTRTFWQRPEQMSACKAVLRIGSSQSFPDSPKRFVSERQSVKVRGTDQWTVRSMSEPPIRRWSEWGDVFCQNAKETVHVRRECGVQAFCEAKPWRRGNSFAPEQIQIQGSRWAQPSGKIRGGHAGGICQ